MNPLIFNKNITVNNKYSSSLLYHEFEINNLREKLERFEITIDELKIFQKVDYDSTEIETINTIIEQHTGIEYDHAKDAKNYFLNEYVTGLIELGFNGDPLRLVEVLVFLDTLEMTSENIKKLFKLNSCMTAVNYITIEGA